MESAKRTYSQFCGIAKALDVVGERWTLLILRDLLMGPRRYSDLLTGLPGITTNLLAKRLKELEETGIIEKKEMVKPASGSAYDLTEAGKALEPALMALGQWGSRYLAKPAADDTLNIGWALISLKRRFIGVRKPIVVKIEVDERVFQYTLSSDYASLIEGAPRVADLTVQGSAAHFRSLFFHGASWKEAIANGSLQFSGDERRLSDFLHAFQFAE